MDCDVMGCAFAFIKDLEDISPRFNLNELSVNTMDDDIEVYLVLEDFNKTITEMIGILNDLIHYHYGLIIGSSIKNKYMRIIFDFDYIYSQIGIYDDVESAQYNNEIYNDHKKAMRSIHDKETNNG